MTDVTRKKTAEKYFLLFPVLFLVELVLGFNGAQLVVAGIPIRYILFILTVVSLYGYAFYCVMEKGMDFSFRGSKSAFHFFTSFDAIVACFLALNVIWVFLIPAFFGGDMGEAISEADSLLLLVLYFPTVFLIRQGRLKWGKTVKTFALCVGALALLYIILYIGSSIDIHFGSNFFQLLHMLSLGTSEIPTVILGNNFIRVAFPCAVFFLPGLYFFFRREKTSTTDYSYYLLVFTAVLTTMLKSLWYGYVIGLMGFLIMSLFLLKSRREALLKVVKVSLFSLVIATVLNFVLFDNLIFVRIVNSIAIPDTSVSQDISVNGAENKASAHDKTASEKKFTGDDGAAISNQIKIEQTKHLLHKWKESPLVGFGYGSYVKEYIRSPENPYSYEMLFPAMLMKLGVAGFGIWIVFLALVIREMFLRCGENKLRFNSWFLLLLSFCATLQTNPLLFNFCGMGVMLFLLVEVAVVHSPEKAV